MAKRRKASKFGKLLKEARISQTDLRNKLEEKDVYKSLMTIHRWYTGECMCRDLFVCKALSEILDKPLDVIVKTFQKK